MWQSLYRVFGVIVLMTQLLATSASAQTKLLRFPDIYEDRIVFSYAGDLWTVSNTGGTATRLTSHPGLELFPKFSPDGTQVAFTGQYDGDEQVYVMPATGGVPTQLTYYPARGPLAPRWGHDNQVYDWTSDGQSVLFRSLRYSTDLSDSRLFLVSSRGGLPVPLAMPESGAGDLSPDGQQVVYSPLFRDFRTWKRYEGGWAQELYIFDRKSHDLDRITDHPRADRDPMWIGDTIFFSSDRDGIVNLYSFHLRNRETRQLTQSDSWDVRWPSDDGSGQIVYELNGELEVYSIAGGRSQRLSITVPTDGVAMRPARVSASTFVEDFGLSPKGERALFVARGDVFTAPIENGPTRNLTKSPGAHEKWAQWSPDGSQIAFISDATGEEEIYIVNQDGSAMPTQLTTGGQAMRYAPVWSPTGRSIAFSDKDGKLSAIDVDTQQLIEIVDEAHGQVRDYTWSPNGSYLAFSLREPSEFSSIFIWSEAENRLRRVTSAQFHEWNPVWDPKGRYLYYLSDRKFAPQLGSFEWNYVVDRETGIYALALSRDEAHPLPPESDEVTVREDETSSQESKDEADVQVDIDFDGLARRVARLPVEFDNYHQLSAGSGQVFFVRSGPSYYGRLSDVKPELQSFALDSRETKTIAEGISGYALSSEGDTLIVRESSVFKVYPVSDGEARVVSTKGLMVDRVPAKEWVQIFDEVWRRFRDFFYVENMHGYDWEALRKQYRPLLTDVAHRSDLNYVIGEMVAELSVGHAYITGGDWEAPSRPSVALPGAIFEADLASNRYRLSEIFEGHNEEERYRAPLTEIGIDAREGDYILAIDGEELHGDDNPYRVLRHRAEQPVRFTLNDQPTLDGARDVVFQPITTERSLRYLEEITVNRQRVDELSDGRVGYLHVPDMGAEGIQEFIKWFYGQIRKEGLVIDVRGNGGGNVSQMLIERLSRSLLGTQFARTYDAPGTYPSTVFHGHLVCILDEDSASDGDIFPYRFREAGLGPLIGKRSWGGVVGITDHGQLMDGGRVNVPQFGTNAVDGDWVIEGIGVEPDILVDNDPKSVIAGSDPQLERAVDEIMTMIQNDPQVLPERPAPPIKTP